MQPTQPMLSQAGTLLQFLEGELETHIAKEEVSLFPRLKAALPVDDRLVDEMVAEHDLIRMKGSDLRAVLGTLLDHHDDLRLGREQLRAALAGSLRDGASPAQVQHAVGVVDAKLRVHFQNEEELLFPLALELLSSAELGRIAAEMAALAESDPAESRADDPPGGLR